jgi:hypothetical protein
MTDIVASKVVSERDKGVPNSENRKGRSKNEKPDMVVKKHQKRGEYEIPSEMKIEGYERRRLAVNFDRIDLICELKPGYNGVGAVLKGFINAIPGYDEFVKKIEEKMDEIEELKKLDTKTNRHFMNWDAAWNLLNKKPDEYLEYIDLIPQIEQLSEDMNNTDDPIERAICSAKLERHAYLHYVYEDYLEVEKQLKATREERDRVRDEYLAKVSEFHALQDQERKMAARIGRDHVTADAKKIHLSDLFPNIRLGFILSNINGDDVENLPFAEVLSVIKTHRPPHRAEFRRYDYKVDPMTGAWVDLERIRELVSGWPFFPSPRRSEPISFHRE